jgi:hypothetical protein
MACRPLLHRMAETIGVPLATGVEPQISRWPESETIMGLVVRRGGVASARQEAGYAIVSGPCTGPKRMLERT